MSLETITSAEDLPKITRLLLEQDLSEEERQNFVFGEDFQGRVYCLLNQTASNLMRKRMQTIKNTYMPGRPFHVNLASDAMITIFRDQAEYDASNDVSSDTDLDQRFTDILLQAVNNGASDVHFEIYQNKADIRFRIHGLLTTISHLDTGTAYRLVNYIYNVAAEEGSKDTQFNLDEMQHALLDRTLEIDGTRHHFKIRLQTAPCYPNSLSIVMRILSIDTQLSLTLQDLGYSLEQTQLLEHAQMKPSGVTIISGTTGSGKSTTLATVLTEIHKHTHGTKKILTTEDPPEYYIAGANQINLSAKQEFEAEGEDMFTKAIKVAMRCDPDVLMVGEVRDKQSADLLSGAVVSGHQVFTTVHAASALAIFDRLIQLGFDKNILTSPGFISLLIYQTLCPILCEQCRIPLEVFKQQKAEDTVYRPLFQRLNKLLRSKRYGNLPTESINIHFANKDGCDHCLMGYVGRTVFAEMVNPDPQLLQYFRNYEYEKAARHWRQHGGVTVLEHGIAKMLLGVVDPLAVENQCGALTSVIED